MRKLLLGFGTITMAVAPMVAVVSCGNTEDDVASSIKATMGDVEYTFELNKNGEVINVVVTANHPVDASTIESDIKSIAQQMQTETDIEVSEEGIAAVAKFAENYQSSKIENNSKPTQQISQTTGGTTPQIPPVTSPTTITHRELPASLESVDDVLSISQRNDWTDFDNQMKNNLMQYNQTNPGVMPTINATVYETKYIKFAFDNDLHYPHDRAQQLISDFYEQTTWGAGLLTMDTILITNKQMGSAGWGGPAKDILVSSNIYNDSNVDQNESSVQMMFDTLRHEYGHHETMGSESRVGGEMPRTNNLINNHMPNWQVLDAVTKARPSTTSPEVEQWQTTMMTNVSADQSDRMVNTIYTAPVFAGMPYGYSVSKQFSFNLGYHYGTAEVLNRTMNVLEASALTSPKYVSGSPIINADNMGFYFSDAQHSQKLLDPTTGFYDQTNTNKVIELWKDYVYGYDTNKLSVDYFNVTGYLDADVDFAVVKKGTSTGLVDQTVQLKKAPSHFISSRTDFATAPTWDTSHVAYSGVIQPMGTYYPMNSSQKDDPNNQPKFYKDSNGNGQLDATDAQVQVAYDFNV